MTAYQTNIRPSSDLRNHYAEIARQARENRQPIHITVNGRGDTVLLCEEDYAALIAERKLWEALNAAEQDVKNGRVAPLEETDQKIQQMLENWRAR